MENRVSLLEDSLFKTDHIVKNIKKTIQHDQNIQDIWNNMKRPNLQIIGIEEGLEAQTKGIRNLFREIISENFPNIEKELNIHVQKISRTPIRQDQRKSSCHKIIKMTNLVAKGRILNASTTK